MQGIYEIRGLVESMFQAIGQRLCQRIRFRVLGVSIDPLQLVPNVTRFSFPDHCQIGTGLFRIRKAGSDVLQIGADSSGTISGMVGIFDEFAFSRMKRMTGQLHAGSRVEGDELLVGRDLEPDGCIRAGVSPKRQRVPVPLKDNRMSNVCENVTLTRL